MQKNSSLANTTQRKKGNTMNAVQTPDQLTHKKCVECEGGVPAYSPGEARKQVEKLPGWKLTEDGKRIRREWVVKDFLTGISFFDEVARLAEAEQHHPDLHLAGYRNAAIEIST